MPRTRLDAQLQEITTQVIQLGTFVDQALEQSLQAIQTGDQALCGLVIISGTFIDDLRAQINYGVFQSLTLQQPLGGRDLRFLSSVPSVVSDLERIASNSIGIARLLVRMAPLQGTERSHVAVEPVRSDQTEKDQPLTEQAILDGILQLGQEARLLLERTMNAFASDDSDGARVIWQEDAMVDVCYQSVRNDIMTMLSGIHAISALEQDERVLQRLTYWLWIAHNLERVGDHCTNICERIVFIIKGDITITSAGEH